MKTLLESLCALNRGQKWALVGIVLGLCGWLIVVFTPGGLFS